MLRSSSRVLQVKVILLTIRWEILYVQTWQRQLPLKEYRCSHLWQTLSRVTFLLCECARLKCVHWKMQPLGWIWGKGLLKFGGGWFGSPLKFIIGSEAWGITQKIVLFTAQPQDDFIFFIIPQASQPNMHFNISELVSLLNYFLKSINLLIPPASNFCSVYLGPIDLYKGFFNFWHGQVRENPSTRLERVPLNSQNC